MSSTREESAPNDSLNSVRIAHASSLSARIPGLSRLALCRRHECRLRPNSSGQHVRTIRDPARRRRVHRPSAPPHSTLCMPERRRPHRRGQRPYKRPTNAEPQPSPIRTAMEIRRISTPEGTTGATIGSFRRDRLKTHPTRHAGKTSLRIHPETRRVTAAEMTSVTRHRMPSLRDARSISRGRTTSTTVTAAAIAVTAVAAGATAPDSRRSPSSPIAKRGWFDRSRDGGFIRRAGNSYLAEPATRGCHRMWSGGNLRRSGDLVVATSGRDHRHRALLVDMLHDQWRPRRRSRPSAPTSSR